MAAAKGPLLVSKCHRDIPTLPKHILSVGTRCLFPCGSSLPGRAGLWQRDQQQYRTL